MIQHGFGDGAHQPKRTTAIDEAHPVLGQHLAKLDRCFNKLGIRAGPGAAIDTDSIDFAHVRHVALQRKAVKSRRSSNPTETYP